MAKGEDEPLMAPGEMKPLLMLSKKQPVNCAIGMTRGKMGVILLDKKAKPRKMLGMLKKKAALAKLDLDTASCRFGKAEVDTEVDSKLVQFIVNKEVSGALRPLLIKQLKLAGFGKCEIRVDEGLEAETDEDETDAEEEAAPAAAAPAGEEAARDGAAAAAAEPAPVAADAAAVTKRFTDLVKRMMAALGSRPAGADAMKTAAMEGQAALKAGNLEAAAAAAETLERLLDAAPAPNGAANGPGSVVFDKARLTWVATRKKIESEIDKLHDQLQETYKGHGVVADLGKVFRQKVGPVMEQFDETLVDKLDEVASATDPATHAKLVGEAKQIIEKYKSFLANEPLIDQLDTNPFVPLSIEKTLVGSLTILSKVVV